MTIAPTPRVATPPRPTAAIANGQPAKTAAPPPPAPAAPANSAAPARDRLQLGAPASAGPGSRQSQLGLPATASAPPVASATPAAAATPNATATPTATATPDATDPAAAATPPADKGSWTVAVNLGANITDKDGNNIAGAEQKREQLTALAEQTEGTDVTIVAQETLTNEDGSQSVKSYTIADGQVEEGETRPSEGAAKDLENLVADAYTRHPAEKTALIQQSHGNGPLGVAGDAGKATLDETSAAIRNGLDRAGVDKLDTLDFDACLMGDTAVLGEMADVADTVVASEELEMGNTSTLGGAVDGQNLADSLSTLVANPEMDGQQLGDAMVEAAERNKRPLEQSEPATGGAPDPDQPSKYENPDYAAGNPTLASYDMAAYDAYRTSLDGLGAELTDAMADPAANAAIQQAIEDTPQLGAKSRDSESRIGQRDVKAFTENLEAAIADGSLPDPDGRIAAAAQQTRADLDDMVESYHGDANGAGYEDLGGLSAFLPDQAMLDAAGNAEKNGMTAQLSKMTDGLNAKFEAAPPDQQAATTAAMAPTVNGFLNAARASLPADQQGALAPLEDAAASLAAAQTPDQAAAALAELDAATAAFMYTPAAQTLTDVKQAEYEKILADTYAASQVGDGSGGWNQFTQALAA